MKTICILSYQRTGSSWLCDTLSGQNTIGIQEVFSKDPLIFLYTFSQILNSIYNIDNNIINVFKNIYSPKNFFIDPTTYIKIKNKILKNKPYNIELLYSIQDIVYKNNNNLVFKIFPEHLDDISLENILNISDYIIVNYRNNLLDSFVSEKKSFISQRWTSLQTERKYLEKINWNKEEYNIYKDKTINILNNFIQKMNKKYVMIAYENIHQSNNKINYIYETIKNIYPDFIWNFKNESMLKKENYLLNIQDNFLNYEEFLLSYNDIKTKIYD
jgi:hypothetical protein